MPAPGEYDVTASPYNAVQNSDPTVTTANIKKAIDAALDNGGGAVRIPSGNFNINGMLLNPVNSQSVWRNPRVTIRGDLPSPASATSYFGTKLTLTSAPLNPVFKVHGNSSSQLATGFTLRDMTIAGAGFGGTIVSFLQATQTRLERVEIRNSRGVGIHGQEWTDSVCHDVSLDDVGDNSSSLPSLHLANPGGTAASACANLRFEAVRFSNHRFYACQLASLTQYIYFLGCSWHGNPAMTSGVPTYPVANVRLDGVYVVSFSGCFFLRAGSHHISANNSTNLLLTTSALHDAWNYGVYLNSTSHVRINVNSFAKSDGSAGNGNPAASPKGNLGTNGTCTGLNLTRNVGGSGVTT